MLTAQGQRMLARLSPLHRDQMQQMVAEMTPPIWDDTEQPDPATAT